MPAITQYLVALAVIVVALEFCIVFRVQRERKILERLNNYSNNTEI